MIAAAPGNGYMIWSGSSAAAPLVTGVAALLKQKYPKESAAQLVQRLIASADDAGVTGRDPLYGYGIFKSAGCDGFGGAYGDGESVGFDF